MSEYPIWIGDAITHALIEHGWLGERTAAPAPTPKPERIKYTSKAALDYVRAHPGASTTEIADALGLVRDAASHRLHRLAQNGMIEKQYDSSSGGRIARWWAKEGT